MCIGPWTRQFFIFSQRSDDARTFRTEGAGPTRVSRLLNRTRRCSRATLQILFLARGVVLVAPRKMRLLTSRQSAATRVCERSIGGIVAFGWSIASSYT